MVRKLEDMTVKAKREAHKKVWDEVVRSKSNVKEETRKEPKEEMKIVSAREKFARIEQPPVQRSSKRAIWFVAVFSIIFLFFSFSLVFLGATLSVGPRVEEFSLNQNFSATKSATAPALSFEQVAIEGVESRTVEGGEEKTVSRRAEGTVVLYNAFSSAVQRLDIDTRLEASNGKIYKTQKAVTIPGMKGSIPGSVEVGIYASEVGEGYNSAPLDFNIVGFKGTSKYSKFYARSKGNIAGGFVGKERVIPEADKEMILNELEETLRSKLLQKVNDQIPEGFILFENAATVSIDSEESKSTGEGNAVEVTVKGTLHGVLFEEKALTLKISEKNFPKDAGSDIYLPNIKSLTFSVNESAGVQSFANIQSLNFNLSGATSAVWRVDEEKLMQDIIGQKKGDINQVLAQHQNIVSANLSLRPFWKRSVPDNKDDVKILVAYPQN